MARPKKEVDMLIAKRIKEARTNTYINGKRLTQEMLANMLFTSIQAVKNWEQGVTSTDDDRLKEISQICNVNFLWLKGLDAKTIVSSTKKMLESTEWQEEVLTTPLEEAKTYALIYSLLMCGYKLDDIHKKDQYSDYMEKAIKSAVEYFMQTLNKEEKENEQRHD